jgi:phosphoribosylanthranilate isomerase
MFIKICGINSAEALSAAVSSGADAVGFVFAESPRKVTPQKAAELTESLPGDIAKVAVMLQPSAADWGEVRDLFAPDWLQTDAKDFMELDVPDSIGRFPVFRDRVSTKFDKEPTELPEHMLFESARSGVGVQPDWDHAAQVARRTCLMLAGGLTPDNVTDAIIHVRPWGVDVSSGVESSPGHKDPAKIAAFTAAAREAGGSHEA